MRLGELLVSEGKITQAELEEALESQVVHGGRLGTNLLELGLVSEQDLVTALGKLHNVAFAAGEMQPDPKALAFIEPKFADDKDLVPMRVDPTRLTVAALNPRDFEAMDALAFKTGKRVVPVVVCEFRINKLLRKHFNAFRTVRALDLEGPKPRNRGAGKAEEAEKGADLMSEDEFQSLYAQVLSGENENEAVDVPLGDLGGEPVPAITQPAAPRRTVSSPGAPAASGAVAAPPSARVPGALQPSAAPGLAARAGPSPAATAGATRPAVPSSTGAGLAAAAAAPIAPSPAAGLASVASGPLPARQPPFGAGLGVGSPAGAPRTPSSPAIPAAVSSATPGARPAPPLPSTGAAAEPIAPPAPVTPLGFAEAQAELAASPDREHIARTVLRFAIGKFKRAILLSVQGQVVTGWHGLGQLREAGVKRIGLSLRAQNTFRLVRDTRSHYVGPMKRDAGTLVFYKLLGGGFPTTAVLLPLLVRGKVVHMLYVDNGADQLTPPDIGELLILSQNVARSYETLIKRRKRS